MLQRKKPACTLRCAFVELQSKMVDAKQKMKMADLQVENFKRSITHTGQYFKKIPFCSSKLRYLFDRDSFSRRYTVV